MTSTIRTELEIVNPGGCPVAQASEAAEAAISHVARSASPDADGRLMEEFAVDGERPLDRPDAETVVASESWTVYRVERDPERGCVCACVERHGCPVSELRAHDGILDISFYAPEIGVVKRIVDDLYDWFDEVHVRKLLRVDGEQTHDFVFVDRERLTDRQREVLEKSYEMGYFEYPKRANAGDVAEALDINRSTFTEHLAAAQGKLLEAILRA